MKRIFLTGLAFISLVFAAPIIAQAQQKTISPQTQASIDLAEAFYIDVLKYRNLNNFDRYIGDTYIQHAPAYGDGPGELMAAVAKELTLSKDVEVRLYRTIAEEDYVAIHSVWFAGGEEYVYVDIWRVEDGKLVEHWDHSQTAPKEAANSNTLYAGSQASIYSTQDIEQNRERAIAVLKVFSHLDNISVAEEFVADDYIQHNPTVANGKEAFIGLLNELRDLNLKIETTIAKTIAMGDMVMVHSKQKDLNNPNDLGTAYIDIFRFSNEGQIVEHWDIEENVPAESANENDIFGYPDKS